jgi:hypothetical protein
LTLATAKLSLSAVNFYKVVFCSTFKAVDKRLFLFAIQAMYSLMNAELFTAVSEGLKQMEITPGSELSGLTRSTRLLWQSWQTGLL